MKEKRFHPSNGTDGMIFESRWCEKCIKNPISPGAGKQCVHLLKALLGDDNGVWIYKDGIPTCKAFKSRAEVYKNRKPSIDKNQIQLF